MASKRPKPTRPKLNTKKVRVSNTNERGNPVPKDAMPEQEATDKLIAEQANNEFEYEANKIIPDTVKESDLSFVPLSEPLDPSPEKIAEYCNRERFLLTDRRSLNKMPRFGTIKARFIAMAEPWGQKLDDIIELKEKLQDGKIPASIQVRAKADEAYAELVLRVLDGDSLSSEFKEASVHHEKYAKAAELTAEIYHKQMQKTFRELEGSMSRRELGMYAQSMWTRNYKHLETSEVFHSSFFARDFSDNADDRMKHYATKSAMEALKWMAFVINEVPVIRETMDNRPVSRPKLN